MHYSKISLVRNLSISLPFDISGRTKLNMTVINLKLFQTLKSHEFEENLTVSR